MANSIEVKGRDFIDVDIRYKALKKINALPTKVLKRLEQLTDSPKAVTYLENDIKFKMIKNIIGA